MVQEGCGENMKRLLDRINAITKRVQNKIILKKVALGNFYYYPVSEYKQGSALPDVQKLGRMFTREESWGGIADSHAWFYKEIEIPKEFEKGRIELSVTTQEHANDVDALNPQFLIYVNGELRQGGDTNHRTLRSREYGKN